MKNAFKELVNKLNSECCPRTQKYQNVYFDHNREKKADMKTQKNIPYAEIILNISKILQDPRAISSQICLV